MNLLQTTARRAAQFVGRESWLVRQLRPAYESLLDVTSGGKGIPWVINGSTYRIDPRQRHRLGEYYDAPVAAFLREHIKPGAICLDVGANVGVYVLQFAQWSAPGGHVYAFEPNPLARAILEKHIRLNDLAEQVTVVPAAIGEIVGKAALYAADADGMSRLGEPNREIAGRTREITVPLITLDQFCEQRDLTPDWLFIDIEGFEIAALVGARKLLTQRNPQVGVVVEMHPNVWDSANTTRQRAETVLRELGRRARPLTGQKDALDEYGLVLLECL